MKKILLSILMSLCTTSLMASLEGKDDGSHQTSHHSNSATQDVVRIYERDIYKVRHQLDAWALNTIPIGHQIPNWSGEPRFAISAHFVNDCALVTLHVLSGRNNVFAITFQNRLNSYDANPEYRNDIADTYRDRFHNPHTAYSVPKLTDEQIRNLSNADFIYRQDHKTLHTTRVVLMRSFVHPVEDSLPKEYVQSIIYATDCVDALFSILSDRDSADKVHNEVLRIVAFEQHERAFKQMLTTLMKEEKNSELIRQAVMNYPKQNHNEPNPEELEDVLHNKLRTFLTQYFDDKGKVKTAEIRKKHFRKHTAGFKKLIDALYKK